MEIGVLIAIIIGAIIFLGIILYLIMWLITKSKGKINIILDNYNFSPGDIIKGKVILLIKKPIKSKELSIRLYGERKSSGINKSSSGVSRTSNTDITFDFKQPIEGEKQYEPGPELTYEFQIKIPKEINSGKLGSVLGTVVKTAQLLSGSNSNIYWYLEASLDIPGINLTKRIQINMA